MADGAVWPRSVRARTTVLATLVSAVALVVSAVGLLVTLDRSLHHAGDNLARDRVTDLGALARQASAKASSKARPKDSASARVVSWNR